MIPQQTNIWYVLQLRTINSHYYRQPWKHGFLSLATQVCDSGNSYYCSYYQGVCNSKVSKVSCAVIGVGG